MTTLSEEVFPGSLQTEHEIGCWRDALETKMNLKHREGYYKTVGSMYLVGSSSALYCNINYPTHTVVVETRTRHRLIDQLFPVPKCLRLSKMSESFHELLTKILRAGSGRSRDELEEMVGESS